MAVHISAWIHDYGSFAIFLLMTLESACIPIPSEIVMPYAGSLVYQQQMSFIWVVVIATIANVVGGLLAYWIGATGGRRVLLKYGKYIFLHESHLHRAEQWFAKYGEWTVFFGRLIPAVRTFVSLPAGVARMNLVKFIIYSALGSLPWNIVLTFAGYELGKHWDVVDPLLKPLTYFGIVVLFLAVVWFWFGKRRRSRNEQAQ